MLRGGVRRACAIGAMLAAGYGAAAPYPDKPIRIIVPAQAGGAADVVARKMGARLTDVWKQSVVVDNRIGVVGAELALQSPADGHTLLFSPDSLIMREAVYRNLPYRTLRDFQPVTLAVVQPNVLLAPVGLPIKSVPELITAARAKPGQYLYGSAGNGTAQHMAGELFKLLARVDLVHVPYKGVPQSITDLIGGRVQLAFGSPVTALPHVRENRLRLLAVTTPRRLASLPDVPTIAEGGVAGYDFTGWLALFAPRGTPAGTVRIIQREVARIVHEPDMSQLLASGGTEPLGNAPEAFAALLKTEIARWTKVAQDARITAE
jgi:tripartite-type tricarboxylate transporter receptor subunit TctC